MNETVTESELELLIQITAQEQREICAADFDIENAPCPNVADVLAKWREAKGTKL